jgi:hypothetical protein
LTCLAKFAFNEVVRKDDEDAISISAFLSVRSCGHEVNCHGQVVDCEVEKLGVLGASFRTSFDLQLIAELPKTTEMTESASRCEVRCATCRNYCALINGLAQILNVLHEINSTICQTLCSLSVREDADKLQDDLILP